MKKANHSQAKQQSNFNQFTKQAISQSQLKQLKGGGDIIIIEEVIGA